MIDPGDLLQSAVVLVVGMLAGFGGFAQWSKSKPEKESLAVDTANTVVQMVRGEIREIGEDVDRLEKRVAALEAEIHVWKTWSNRALDLIDRLLNMLDHNDRNKVAHEVEKVKKSRPGVL